MSDLLIRAKEVRKQKRSARTLPHDPEAALAWARGDITGSQLMKALGGSGTNPSTLYCWLAGSLRAAIRERLLVEVENHAE